jgi:hypothetical protein
MKHLTCTCLLIGTVPLSLFAAAIPASANDSPSIPVEAVAPLESPTGTVRDLGTIPERNGLEWYWEKQEGGEKTDSGATLKLPETITPPTEELANPADAAPNEASWGNAGERRRRGATLDLTEF